MNKKDCRFNCILCNKYYSSGNSLWNHTKKFHTLNNPNIPNTSNIVPNIPNNNVKTYNCRYCNKIFNNVKTRWSHEQKCKETKIQENNKIELLENKIKELESKINNNKIITTNNNSTINNGIINNTTNITINQFGKENINAISIKEIKELIKNDNYLVDIVKLLNFNEKYPENHNFCNTSLEGKYISIFNSSTNKIEKLNKNDFYDRVLCNSFTKMDNLSLILELNNDIRDQIKEKYINHLDNKLLHIKDIFYKDKIYKKNYKTNINELSYNKNKVVLDTWANITDTTIQDDNLSDSEESTNSKHSAFTTDSSDSE
jgi:hypothetical protein